MILIDFSINGIEYRIQKKNKKIVEIVYKDTMRRVENEKEVCRKYGLNVPTDARVMNTHQAINCLIKHLRKT